MAKMTFDQFKATLNHDPKKTSSSARARLAEAARKERVIAECSDWGTSILMQIARISTEVDGLPNHIPLKSPYNPVSGLALVLADGKWRIGGRDEALVESNRLRLTGYSTVTSRMILEGLGVDVNLESLQRIAQIASWGGYESKQASILKDTFGMLHDHTVRAAVGHGMTVRTRLHWGGEPSTWLRAAWESVDLFPEHAPESFDGVRSPMYEGAANGDANLMLSLLSMVPPQGREFHDCEGQGAAALMAVMRHGNSNRVVTMEALLEGGVSPDSRDPDGGTALHVMAEHLWNDDSGIGLELAESLIKAGVDPSALDGKRRTALDILHEQSGGMAFSPEDDDLIGLLESHARTPSRR